MSGAGLVRVSGTERVSRLSCCAVECLWLKILGSKFGIILDYPPLLLTGNVSCGPRYAPRLDVVAPGCPSGSFCMNLIGHIRIR